MRMNKTKMRLSQSFQRWLIILVAIAFLATTAFLWLIQTRLSHENAIRLLELNLADVREDIIDASDANLLKLTRSVAQELNAQENIDDALLNELMVKFENYTKEQQEKQKAQLEECEVKIQTSKILINELNKKLSSLMLEQKNIEREKEKMQGAYKAYCSGILKQYSESLCSLSTEFSQILDNITVLQKNMAETDMFYLKE